MRAHLTDEQLQEIVDNDLQNVEPEINQHLQSCWHCTQQVQQYRMISKILADDPAPEIPAGFADAVVQHIVIREEKHEKWVESSIFGGIFAIILANILFVLFWRKDFSGDMLESTLEVLHKFSFFGDWVNTLAKSMSIFTELFSGYGLIFLSAAAIFAIIFFLEKVLIPEHK
ncbi:MAG: hypothetical protein KDH95_16325 [Calditrichaeota bacterium]|nr:hypothetical protein [Calditrichota bacterium]MCB0269726.1 hypothetical protein [Calditrichota bacterium]MCB9070483.1 hypothetical protein [Calditrichia bacterium]